MIVSDPMSLTDAVAAGLPVSDLQAAVTALEAQIAAMSPEPPPAE